jgi:hypothetical protein
MAKVVGLTRERLSLLETKSGEGDKRKAFFVGDEEWRLN